VKITEKNSKAIFFDRDGTLIIDKNYLNDPDLIQFFPDTLKALVILYNLGYQFFVVTNQSGVARGLITIDQVEAIHQRMNEILKNHHPKLIIEKFLFCPHVPSDHCSCRKPKPGMIEAILKSNCDIDVKSSWMIGDKDIDVQAGEAMGLNTYHIINGDLLSFINKIISQ